MLNNFSVKNIINNQQFQNGVKPDERRAMNVFDILVKNAIKVAHEPQRVQQKSFQI
jgi:hypothetical protein